MKFLHGDCLLVRTDIKKNKQISNIRDFGLAQIETGNYQHGLPLRIAESQNQTFASINAKFIHDYPYFEKLCKNKSYWGSLTRPDLRNDRFGPKNGQKSPVLFL